MYELQSQADMGSSFERAFYIDAIEKVIQEIDYLVTKDHEI